MRKIAKYLFFAVMATLTLASCEKEKENPVLNPQGTPVKFALSAKATSKTAAELKVVADTPVPADVTIAFAVNAESSMPADALTFPATATMAKGETEITASLSVDVEKLVPGTTTTAKIEASISEVVFGVVDVISVTTEPAKEPEPEPSSDSDITIDGNFDDWAEVTTGIASEDDEAPLKEFKVAYDKEYIYFYHKRNDNPAMWGGGYFYLAVDADNNVATGMTDANGNAVIGIEKWMYLYFFLADEGGNPMLATAPAGARESGDEYACAENSLAGIIGDGIVETELRIPLGDLGITYGQPIKVYTWGNKSASNMKDQPVVVSMGGTAPEPQPTGITVDGNPAEWAGLEGVASSECDAAAELNGIKSAKAYYDDKLYMLLEVTDDALAKGVADGKLRFHIFFNSDYSADGGYNSHWGLQNINYATEGKMTSGGAYTSYSSNLYAINPGTEWVTSDTGFTPVFVSAGEGNFYELSMELENFPGGLATTIGIGFDIADGDYACMGFMPNDASGQLLSVVKKGTTPLDPPEPEVEGLIKIDGDFSDWAEIEAVGAGNHKEFKCAIDDNYIYFFTWRDNKDEEYSQIWGNSSEGYIYVALDTDKNPETGVNLWSNGPYEFVGYHFPFGGSAASPAINENPGASTSCAPSTATTKNIYCKGVVGDDGAKIEYRIPRADLPEIPSTPFIVYSWGSLGLDKVEYHVGEPQPQPDEGPVTIADIIAQIPASATGNDTAVEFEANLKNPAVVSYVNGNNAYIQDQTGAILIYLKDHGLVAGNTIKGKMAIKAYWYNGIPEMVAIGTEYEKGEGTAPAPKEITIADLLANYDANLLRLVVLKGVSVTDGISDGDRNGEIAQGDNKIAVYAQLNNKGLVLTEGKNGDLVTIPAYYKANKQVYLWDNAWFTEAAPAQVGGITIDGDMADWANVATGISDTAGPYLDFKATYDAEYIYFYSKRTWHDGLWKDSSGGYYYFEIDTDNDPTTGMAGADVVNGNPGYGVEYWMYLYLFTGTKDAPTFAATPAGSGSPSGCNANAIAAGVTDKSIIETEVRVPRADVGLTSPGTIRIYTWGNKDAKNLKSETSYLSLTIE